MPGIESFNRRRPDDADDLRTAEQLRALYKRALTALNQYLTVKLGAGKAPLAGLLLNYIFADEVLAQDDPAVAAAAREFTSVGSHVLADRTRELLENLPLLRRPLLSTLWVKRFIDLAHERRSLVDALDRSWIFRTYSEQYPLLTLTQYGVALRDFEEQIGLELLDYVARGHETASSPDGDDAEDKASLISALAEYAQVLNDALERETHHDNRMHHLGHLAMAARMFTYLHHEPSSISLSQIHRIESSSHGSIKLPGDTAQRVRDAWCHFEPILRKYVQCESDANA